MRKAVWTLSLMLLVFSSCNQAPIPEQKAPEETTIGAPTTASSVVSSSLSIVVKAKGVSTIPYHTLRVSGSSSPKVWLTESTTLTGLIPGTYTVTAGTFLIGVDHPICKIYSPNPSSQSLVLAAGQTATATVTYTSQPCPGS